MLFEGTSTKERLVTCRLTLVLQFKGAEKWDSSLGGLWREGVLSEE